MTPFAGIISGLGIISGPIWGSFAGQDHLPVCTDPMDFKTILMTFGMWIQSKVISSSDRLFFLDQHLLGEPRELISGFLHMEPDKGCMQARRLLQREYGDPYKVSSAYIKYNDGPALKSLSIFLAKCNSALKTISHLAVLNHEC